MKTLLAALAAALYIAAASAPAYAIGKCSNLGPGKKLTCCAMHPNSPACR